MNIGFAQINATVGDLSGNCELIMRAYERLAAAGAELVLTRSWRLLDIHHRTWF
jgi:predicted amidohydrolase